MRRKFWGNYPWPLVLLLLVMLCSTPRGTSQEDADPLDAFLLAHIEDGNFDEALTMLDSTLDQSVLPRYLNFQNSMGYTLLHYACSRGDTDGAYSLLQRGADVHVPNEVINGFTALHWATSIGASAVVQTLLEHGADLEAKDFNGRTPLHIACERGHQDVALLLIQQGASILRESSDLKTPLHYAAFSGMLPLVQLLLERGVDVNMRTKWRDTALHYASSFTQGSPNTRLAIVQLLLDSGADVNAQGMQSDTPIHWACWKGLVNVAELLARHGGDVDVKRGDGDEGGDVTPFSLGACEASPVRARLQRYYREYRIWHLEEDLDQDGDANPNPNPNPNPNLEEDLDQDGDAARDAQQHGQQREDEEQGWEQGGGREEGAGQRGVCLEGDPGCVDGGDGGPLPDPARWAVGGHLSGRGGEGGGAGERRHDGSEL